VPLTCNNRNIAPGQMSPFRHIPSHSDHLPLTFPPFRLPLPITDTGRSANPSERDSHPIKEPGRVIAMGEIIEFACNGGTAEGYLAVPSGGPSLDQESSSFKSGGVWSTRSNGPVTGSPRSGSLRSPPTSTTGRQFLSPSRMKRAKR